MKEARRKIVEAIKRNGPYSHNIVSLVLIEVSKQYGVKEANSLVTELKLTELYGIEPESETEE